MRRLIVVALLAFTLVGGTALAQQFSTLEERMSQSEFKAAGLDKLTPAELAALNAWLAGKVSAAAPAAAPAQDLRGFENRSFGDDSAVVSTVPGEFTGWQAAGTRFNLANGQVWQVIDSSTRLRVKLTDPTVTIDKGALGTWYLRVDGYNTRAKVKRVK